MADQQEGDDETDVSLITGALRSRNLPSGEPADSSFGSSVVLRNQTTTVADANSAGTEQSETSSILIYCSFFFFFFFNSMSKALIQWIIYGLVNTLLLLFSSVFPGGSKLARPGAEAGGNSCSKGSAGQERHSYRLRRRRSALMMPQFIHFRMDSV